MQWGGPSTSPTLYGPGRPPDPQVDAKAKRRRFTVEEKLRILREADRCRVRGEIGALLRREGLYSSLLSAWRAQRDQGALAELGRRRRGPKPRPVDPRLAQLERENRRLRRRLEQAEVIIAFQKKQARLITRRAYGFHSAAALEARIHLCCGGITLNPPLPSPTSPSPDLSSSRGSR